MFPFRTAKHSRSKFNCSNRPSHNSPRSKILKQIFKFAQEWVALKQGLFPEAPDNHHALEDLCMINLAASTACLQVSRNMNKRGLSSHHETGLLGNA